MLDKDRFEVKLNPKFVSDKDKVTLGAPYAGFGGDQMPS